MNSRELEIIKWVALGKSDCVIAGLFGIREQDIRREIHDISEKLDTSDRIEMGLKAIKLGLV